MNAEETATVLAKCAALDRRTVGRADVLAWHEILADVEFVDALDAVRRWYSDHREWIMPSDVRTLAADARRDRRQAQREREQAAPPPALERTDRGDEIRDAVRAMLPVGDPDKLRWGHRSWRELQRDWKRQLDAVPNPYYDPTVHARLAEIDPP